MLPPLAGRGDDHGIPPRPIGLRLTADFDDLERVGVDVEHMVVVLVGVADRPFLHRAQPYPLVDARGIEDLAIHGEDEFLPVAGDIVLRRGGAEDQGAPAGDLAVADRLRAAAWAMPPGAPSAAARRRRRRAPAVRSARRDPDRTAWR